MEENKNELGIIRVAGLSQKEFIKFNETNSYLYILSLELIKLENKLNNTIQKLDSMLYTQVKYNKDFLKLKRKVNHNKSITNYNIENLNENLKTLLNDYTIIRNLIMENKKKINVDNLFDDKEIQNLIDIYLENKLIIDKAIIVSSKDFYYSIEKNIIKWKETKKIERRFLITLYKYLIRSSYKTSPFSFYCLQGIIGGKTTSKKYLNEISSHSYATLSLMNIETKKEKFKLNKDVWIKYDNIEILRKSRNNYRNLIRNNRRDLISIDYNENIEKLIKKIKNKTLERDELLNIIQEIFKIEEQESNQLLLTLCHIGIVENVLYSSDIINYQPEILKKVDLDNNRVYLIQKFDNNIYEEVFLDENIEYNFIKQIDTMILNKIMIIFDDSIILKNQFIEYIGKNLTMNINELAKILKDFYTNKDKLFNYSIELINKTREMLIEYIMNNLDKDEILLKEEFINLLYKNIKTTMDNTYSYTYFYQSNDELVVLNKVFSGFTRMFNKFENIKEDVRENSINLLNFKNDIQYLDLYSVYDFNANVRPLKTEHIVDLENIWSLDSLKELTIDVDYLNKKIIFRKNNVIVKPINLAATSSRMFPLIHGFICDISHGDTINFEMHIINKIGKIKEMIIIPRVKIKNIIISRKKWIINTKNKLEYTYDNIIRFFIKNNIPNSFYVRPIKSKKINNISQMNDYFKPQFINIKSAISYQIFNKIVENCDLLLIEEALPLYDNSFKNKEFYEGHLYEVGVESYFTKMDNDKC